MTNQVKKMTRDTAGLRDALFDEIESLRIGGDPLKSMAVANVAKQIINTAKVELEFHRVLREYADAGVPLELGKLQLGSVDG